MGREEWNNVLKGKVMEFRGITTNPHQAAQDREQLLHDRRVEKAEHDRMIWEGLRSTESVQPYITRRMLEAQSQDCKLLNEMKQKEISEIMIKKNAEIEQKLGFFLDRQHFEEESRAKRTVALRQNDPELMKFARAVRSRAVGIMQRSQAIATELNRKMKKAEEDRIEREWMDALIASEQERECQERIAKYKVKQEFAKCVQDQLRDKMTLRCGDFQKEKHRCETVVAKELAELQAEKDLALKRKLELRDIFLAELERRRQARQDANKGEHEFILKKQQEMQEIEDFKDYKKELIRAAAEANRQKQVRAADQLVALKAAHDEELNSRAEKAAEQMAIDKTVLHSSMERDDIFREPFERVKKHADFRHELDLNNKWVAERRQLEREADAESTRVYLEACDRQNELYKHRDKLRRQNGLDTGECLRSQIAAKEKEREEAKLEKIAYAKSMEEAMRKLDEEINAEKKKLMDEFTIWKANVFLPEIEEKAKCANRAEREKRTIADNVTVRISETQDAFGTWQPEKPYHPLVRKA